ncbi:MAG TPA: rod shape-determining protein RodA [Patescibacteria group bacterium]|nr:rod shape-determining protein RodA [Patescibacteria group bacterium]
MKARVHTVDLDWWLIALVAALCCLGLLEVHSATHRAMAGMVWRQMGWVGLGFLALWLLSRLDYQWVLDRAPLLYMLMLGALVIVLVAGHARFGARRWVEIGGIPFQLSEFAKLVIIIVLARFLSEVRTDRLALADLVKVGVLVGVPLVLILLQPDLGTALTLVPITVAGAFLAGIKWRHVLALVVLAGLSLPVAWHFVLKPYQKARITTFLQPEKDPQGSGYQILQSEIAVGSGGLWGKGLGHGSQNQLGFVPVRYSDFILAALGEELGFAGVFFTLLLYAGLFSCLILNARQAKDRAGMYLVGGVAAILAFHVFVNAAMVIGWMPVTGIPLPLVSYGGSATLFVFMALGLVMSVRLRRFVN